MDHVSSKDNFIGDPLEVELDVTCQEWYLSSSKEEILE
jgi:hypothetical protein